MIFIEVAAVHFFSMNNPDRLVPMTRQYKFALGRAVFLTKGSRTQYGCPGTRINGRAAYNMGDLCDYVFRRVFEAMADPFNTVHSKSSPRARHLRPNEIARRISRTINKEPSE